MTSWMDAPKFLREYELELDKEFESNGKAAEWANDTYAHRIWGTEDDAFSLRDDDPTTDRINDFDEAEAALSHDCQFLAVSTNAVIRIYHVQSKEMRAELIGHQHNVDQLHFAPGARKHNVSSGDDAGIGEQTYRLLSNAREEGEEIIAWALDQDGKQVSRTMPFAIQDMADRAISAISSDLVTHHSQNDYEIDTIRTGFCETLQTGDAKNRVKTLPSWSGIFPSFGAYPISPDGTSILYIVHHDTTQSGIRPADELPQIVVSDIGTQTERCRLRGHTDAIMWAGWSPDGKTIATACWDQHFKIWDAHTGECRHTIGPTGCQNWRGEFSPNGKHILFSGARQTKVAIYHVDTGEEVAECKAKGLEFKGWVRYLAWNPAGDCIVIPNELDVILWYPFQNKVETIFALKNDKSMLKRYNEFSVVKWADGGRKLLLQDVSQTIFVWDRERNCKWRLERPQGMALGLYAKEVFHVADGAMIVSMNGDRKVRYWKL